MSRVLAQFVREAGAGENVLARLVKRNGQNIRVVIKSGLHPVAVVGVNVNVGHPPACGQHTLDSDRPIAKDAKAGGKIPPGMMQPSGKTKSHLYFIFEQQFGPNQGRPNL